MDLISHIEKYCGRIEKGWGPENNYKGIQCVRFANQPFENLFTYSTLGLSDSVLDLNKGKKVRHELLFTVAKQFLNAKVPSLLISLAESMIDKNYGLLRGEVIGPYSKLFFEYDFTGVYISIPAFFEDDFYVYTKSNPSTVFVWLIPVFTREIEFIKTHGWQDFEKILENTNQENFWNLNREAFIS